MLADSSELLFLIPLAAAALVLIARLDIYFSIRQSRIAEARYLAEMQSFYDRPRFVIMHDSIAAHRTKIRV